MYTNEAKEEKKEGKLKEKLRQRKNNTMALCRYCQTQVQYIICHTIITNFFDYIFKNTIILLTTLSDDDAATSTNMLTKIILQQNWNN